MQWLRALLKATVWDGLTTLLDRMGFAPAMVQVLCIDLAAGRLLVLRSGEYRSGYGPVQGLRRGALTFGLVPLRTDVREDARQELLAAALREAPPIAALRVAERYRAGRHRQLDCSVVVLFCTMSELPLRSETGKGEPCWLPVSAAVAAFGNQTLRDMLADWRAAASAGRRGADGAADRLVATSAQRFLIGPPAEVRAAAIRGPALAQPQSGLSAALERFWSMPLMMMQAARELGARGFEEVYQADRRSAADLWSRMSIDARDCYRPDPRLWRDCRILDARRVPDLLRGWLDARIERLTGQRADSAAGSIPGWASPETALRLQARSGCEVSLDLIYDSEEDRVGCFLTAGGTECAPSDVLRYALLSQRYLPIPVFHTSTAYRTEIGYKQASPADFRAIGALHHRLDGAAVGRARFYPDGTGSEYGVTGHDRCFFRRAADPLLPPGGETVTTFLDIDLSEQPSPIRG